VVLPSLLNYTSGAQFDNTPGDVRHIDAPSTRPLYALAPAFKPAMGVLVKVGEGW